MRVHVVVLLSILGLAAALIAGCGGGGGDGAGGGLQVSVTDDAGGAVTAQRAASAVFMGVSGLAPGQDVELMLFLPSGQPAYEAPLLMTADATGSIPPGPIIYDLIAEQDGTVKSLVQFMGDYTLRIVGQGVDRTLTFTIGLRASDRAIPGGALIVILSKDDRVAQGSIGEGEAVKVRGMGFAPGQQVRLFVVPDQRAWAVGNPLDDVTGEVETATADQDGNFTVVVWQSAAPQGDNHDFDVVAHEGAGDTLVSGDLVEGYSITGFTVQGPPSGDLLYQLACTPSGSYVDEFQVGDTVTVWVNPPSRPLNLYRSVAKYIVAHKATWAQGDKLVDVTGRPEWDLVRYACSNEFYYTVWANAQPGKYDVVIDVNGNGVYTPGTDVLDDGREPGSSTDAGFKVGTLSPKVVVAGNPAVIDAGSPSSISALVLDETWSPVADTTVTFSVVSGSGSLSAATAQTGPDGIATVQLTGTTPGSQTTVRGSATVGASSITGETTIRTRTSGGLGVIVKSRRGR